MHPERLPSIARALLVCAVLLVNSALAQEPMPADLGTAQWIGAPAEGLPTEMLGARPGWYWAPAESQRLQLRRRIEVPAEFRGARAVLYLSADDAFDVWIDGAAIGGDREWRRFSVIDLGASVTPGTLVVAITARNDGGPCGIVGGLLLESALPPHERRFVAIDSTWRASAEAPKGWEEPTFDDSGWSPPRRVANFDDAPWGRPSAPNGGRAPWILERRFTLDAAPKTGAMTITALGGYRLRINGKAVGERPADGVRLLAPAASPFLAPEWTDYRKRVLARTFDVGSLLVKGENVISVTLGDLWYSSALGWTLARDNFGDRPPRLLARLCIDAGERPIEVVTDEHWRMMRGPILSSEIYGGERYDARLEIDALGDAGAKPRLHAVAAEERTATPLVMMQTTPSIEVWQDVRPIEIVGRDDGVQVVDFGQNVVGCLRITIRGEPGRPVVMRFGERLDANGRLDVRNLRRAMQTEIYIPRSPEAATYEPSFTYHGFRFVEISGLPRRLANEDCLARAFGTEVSGPEARFESASGERVDLMRLLSAIRWGIRGNLMSVPTDCPQRDERLGWTGDAGIIWRTAAHFFDMRGMTRKWMQDMEDAQSEAGGYPDVAPRVIDLADGAPGWGDAGIILPWTAWWHDGDLGVARRHWDSMTRWMKYIEEVNPEGLWLARRNNDFGDWVAPDGKTSKDVIASTVWAKDALMMADLATALGRDDEAERYRELHRKIAHAFRSRFIDAKGRIGTDTQTSIVLAIDAEVVPAEQRASAIERLVADIRGRDTHLSTGFLGTPKLLPMLSEGGRSDVAFDLLFQSTYPSWGYMLAQGATTIWELWNGDVGDPGMNSHNHDAFGCVGEWLYRYAAGIDGRAPGFAKVIVRPHFDARLPNADVPVRTPHGVIRVAWRPSQAAGRWDFEVEIPEGVLATLELPEGDASSEAGSAARRSSRPLEPGRFTTTIAAPRAR